MFHSLSELLTYATTFLPLTCGNDPVKNLIVSEHSFP